MREKILIVDDEEINREILQEMLEEQYGILTAADGDEAIEQLTQFSGDIAVVLLDLIMPKKDGYAVLELMKERQYLDKIPVLVISSETSIQTEKKCFDMGISDFIRKPFSNVLVKKRVENIVNLFTWKNELEDTVERQTETLRKQYKILRLQAEKLQKSNVKIIDILGSVVESRNLESDDHIRRVKKLTRILAEALKALYPEYGLTEEEVDIIVSSSALHDIGKIEIPDHILLKPGKLTEEEKEYMKSHTLRGCEILEHIEGVWDDKYGKTCYEICRHHHERYDGKGYPDGLIGEAIPISAQIVSIADKYDELISEQMYKRAFTKEQAFHMLVDGECGVFSPKLMECFRRKRKELEAQISLDNMV